MTDKPLSGKTALVTGGSKRIGRAICLALAQDGADIVIHFRGSADNADELRTRIEASGVKAWTVSADLAKPDECETLIRRAMDAAGGLDILVNSASIFPANTLADVTFDSLMESMRVNAWAPFTLMRDFANLAKQGAIVNMVDSRVVGYDWNHVAYILSKHVLREMTRMAAVQYAPNITVNGVCPGLILPPPGKTDDYLDKLTRTVPLKRHGNATEIADAVLYLVKARFVTGTLLFVDGGRHIQEYSSGPHPD
jgi:pteridine reductase